MDVILRPIESCSWMDREDGTCNHPGQDTPECHLGVCPRLARLRDHGQQRYTVVASTNNGLDLYFSIAAATSDEAREKCAKAAVDRRLTKKVVGTSAWVECRLNPQLVYVKSKYPDIPEDADFGTSEMDPESELRQAGLDHKGRP